MQAAPCPVCGSADVERDEVWNAGALMLAECRRCEHLWTGPVQVGSAAGLARPLARPVELPRRLPQLLPQARPLPQAAQFQAQFQAQDQAQFQAQAELQTQAQASSQRSRTVPPSRGAQGEAAAPRRGDRSRAGVASAA